MSNLAVIQAGSEDLPTRLTNLEAAIRYQEIPVALGRAQAISVNSEQQFITAAAAVALTLSNPIAGQPIVGGTGQDGLILEITDTTGKAHTVTTGTNGLNGSKHVLTFPGTVGVTVRLRAYGGSWWLQVANGAALT